MSDRIAELHDEVLDAADRLLGIAEVQMADAWADGRLEAATRWFALAQHLAAGVRAVKPELHREAR